MNEKEIAQNILLLKHFNSICTQNNIFYTLINDTLISAIENNNKWQEKKYFEVLMDIDSYLKLKKYSIINCLDNITNSNYFELNPKFVWDKNKFGYFDVFLKIIILIPSKKKKAIKICNIFNKLKIIIAKEKTNIALGKQISFFKKILLFLIPTYKFKFTTYDICDKLSIDSFSSSNGFFVIDDKNFDFKSCWILNFIFDTKNIFFFDIEFKIVIKNNYLPKSSFSKNNELYKKK